MSDYDDMMADGGAPVLDGVFGVTASYQAKGSTDVVSVTVQDAGSASGGRRMQEGARVGAMPDRKFLLAAGDVTPARGGVLTVAGVAWAIREAVLVDGFWELMGAQRNVDHVGTGARV